METYLQACKTFGQQRNKEDRRRNRTRLRQGRERELGQQDVGANIWSAVLAVDWPVVNVVIGRPDPEVLLSLLRGQAADYTN